MSFQATAYLRASGGWIFPVVLASVLSLLAGATDVCAQGELALDPFLSADRRSADTTIGQYDSSVQPTSFQQVSHTSPQAAWAPPPLPAYSVVGGPGCEGCELPAGYAQGPYLGASPYDAPSSAWRWELLPDGLIYRSYLAGPRESRMALHAFHNESSSLRSEWLWDATLGGRRGIMRFGNGDPSNPEGWQLDIEGAAVVRLNIDENRDVDASDFRFGVPLTYGVGPIQYKMGYYHVSSHLGDEFIARTGMNTRINYVRDALVFGVSYEVNPCFRIYGETAYAFFTAGGAEPWEFQFGAEYSRPGPTGFYGTPFFATNAHLREELNFGGDWTVQAGWLWRGPTENTFRLGLHYMNGKSTQYQFFTTNERQLGVGIWYDF